MQPTSLRPHFDQRRQFYDSCVQTRTNIRNVFKHLKETLEMREEELLSNMEFIEQQEYEKFYHNVMQEASPSHTSHSFGKFLIKGEDKAKNCASEIKKLLQVQFLDKNTSISGFENFESFDSEDAFTASSENSDPSFVIVESQTDELEQGENFAPSPHDWKDSFYPDSYSAPSWEETLAEIKARPMSDWCLKTPTRTEANSKAPSNAETSSSSTWDEVLADIFAQPMSNWLLESPKATATANRTCLQVCEVPEETMQVDIENISSLTCVSTKAHFMTPDVVDQLPASAQVCQSRTEICTSLDKCQAEENCGMKKWLLDERALPSYQSDFLTKRFDTMKINVARKPDWAKWLSTNQ